MTQTIVERDGLTVRTSRDAGAFYCAHALFAVNRHLSSSCLRAASGVPLVGFLHVPSDPWTSSTTRPPANDAKPGRHAAMQKVMAAALAGLVDLASEDAAGFRGRLRVLMTGFSEFRDVTSNPTGAFVSDLGVMQETLEAATNERAVVDVGEDSANATIRTPTVEVIPRTLHVDDRALDPSDRSSLFALINDYDPHVVVATGVCRDASFRVELLPSDIGLAHATDRATPWTHAAGQPPTTVLDENAMLAEAIVRGFARPRASDAVV